MLSSFLGEIVFTLLWIVIGFAVTYLPPDQRRPTWTLWGVVGLIVVGYWNVMHWAYDAWASPQYSHGYLIPAFTIFLLWIRREPFGPVTDRERWYGLGALLLFSAVRGYAAFVRINALDMYTFVPVMLAALLMVGGWRLIRWAGPPVLFLIFMFPLSPKMEQFSLKPLQGVAMKGATYALQTVGIETFAMGNTIHIHDGSDDKYKELNVAEACSGLRMLTIFTAMAVATVMIVPGALWEKMVIIASALPIALFVNVARIVVYGVLKLMSDGAAESFHDTWAAFFMMPMALGMMYLLYSILHNLVIDDRVTAPVPVFGVSPAMQFPPARPGPSVPRS